jgi:hypothetical protein
MITVTDLPNDTLLLLEENDTTPMLLFSSLPMGYFDKFSWEGDDHGINETNRYDPVVPLQSIPKHNTSHFGETKTSLETNVSTSTWPPKIDASLLSYRVSFQIPYPLSNERTFGLAIRPLYGNHRIKEDVIFSFARGYGLSEYLLFVSSLLATNFTGDLVLGVASKDNLKDDVQEYLEYLSKYHHVIVYEIPLQCILVKIRTHCQTQGFFFFRDSRRHEVVWKDPRPPREIAQLRFEYYWAWSTLYSSSSNIWLLDSRDVYFQRHPMTYLIPTNDTTTNTTTTTTTLHVFEESNRELLWQQRSNRRWIKAAYGEDWFQVLRYRTVLCSGSTFGGQPAIHTYTSAMIRQYDVTNCTIYGCDQGHHNFLFLTNQLLGGPNITSIVIHPQGTSTVNTLGLLISEKSNLTSLGVLRSDGFIYNTNGEVSPIIHQYDRDIKLSQIMEKRKQLLLRNWKNTQRSNVVDKKESWNVTKR